MRTSYANKSRANFLQKDKEKFFCAQVTKKLLKKFFKWNTRSRRKYKPFSSLNLIYRVGPAVGCYFRWANCHYR